MSGMCVRTTGPLVEPSLVCSPVIRLLPLFIREKRRWLADLAVVGLVNGLGNAHRTSAQRARIGEINVRAPADRSEVQAVPSNAPWKFN